MSNPWSEFVTEDLEDEAPIPLRSIPSRPLSAWDTDNPIMPPAPVPFPRIERSPTPDAGHMFGIGGGSQRPSFIVPESAPSSPKIGGLAHDCEFVNSQLYEVTFHGNRSQTFKCTSSGIFNDGDFVITEADRGYDIGNITKIIPCPSSHAAASAKLIYRKATSSEIDMIPSKIEKEKRAIRICQEKADENHLQMTITDAEFQFDGKKLTIYFSAKRYIDFRNLVRSLFKIFETRIWMVWRDESGPVKDIFLQHPQQK